MPPPRRRPRSTAHRAAFVDASGFIALFSRDDANHGHAEALIQAAIASRVRLVTSNLVLAEMHRLLLHRAGSRAAMTALDKVTQSPSVSVEHATEAYLRRARAWLDDLADQVITLTDAVSFAIMEATRCRVALTFDRDFWIAGFERYDVGKP